MQATLPLIDMAVAKEQFKLAATLTAVAQASARKSNQVDLAKTLLARSKELVLDEKRAAAAEDARKRLAEDSNDSAAQLVLGRYLCFVRKTGKRAYPT